MSRPQPRLLTAPLDRDIRPTPWAVFGPLHEEFGFAIDVCASAENTKCDRFYGVEDDGLSQPWAPEVCWCNPPYSEIQKWVEKAYKESLAGATVVMLLPVSTDTRWFHSWVYHKAEVKFLKGRIKFEGQKQHAPFASMLVIYRPAKQELSGGTSE